MKAKSNKRGSNRPLRTGSAKSGSKDPRLAVSVPSRVVGYARVSTADQSLQMQIDALVRSGVPEANIWSEHISGVSRKRRALESAIADLRPAMGDRPGDTFVVYKLDRMGRNTLDLLTKMKYFDDNGITFRSLTENIDTATPSGRFMMVAIAAMAEFERNLIRERTMEGVRSHRARGGRHGGQKKLTDDRHRELVDMRVSGTTLDALAKKFRISRQSVVNYLKRPLRKRAKK